MAALYSFFFMFLSPERMRTWIRDFCTYALCFIKSGGEERVLL